MAYPAIIFDGPDGTGKTTQSLLLAKFLREEPHIPVIYVSFPVYETLVGKTIGRFLGRWGDEEKITLSSPEDRAFLFSLNRLEILPALKLLLEGRGYLPIFNRGPYANLFNVAKRALQDGVDWDKLLSLEKKRRVDDILKMDNEFLSVVGRGREVIHLFLHLPSEESMELARERAAESLGQGPDEHEGDFELQRLTAQIYREVAEGKIEGHQAELVEATRGSFRRQWETPWVQEGVSELEGILATAKEVSRVVFPHLIGNEWQSAWSSYAQEIHSHAFDLWRSSKFRRKEEFEFREILGLGDGSSLSLDLRKPKQVELREKRPAVWQAIEESRRLDEELTRSREGACFVNKERL